MANKPLLFTIVAIIGTASLIGALAVSSVFPLSDPDEATVAIDEVSSEMPADAIQQSEPRSEVEDAEDSHSGFGDAFATPEEQAADEEQAYATAEEAGAMADKAARMADEAKQAASAPSADTADQSGASSGTEIQQ